MKRDILHYAATVSLMALLVFGSVHFITTAVAFRRSDEYFENVPFEWDDDNDEYILSIRETNDKGLDSIVHYTVPTKETTLVFSEDHWSCCGDIVSYYNAFGRMLLKRVEGFHINVFKEERK